MIKKFFKRYAKKLEASDSGGLPIWFNSDLLNATFDELQTAVSETTMLASNISTQLERKLHATELQLSVVIDIIAEAVVIIDDEHNIIEWSRGAQTTFGYTKQEAVGKPMRFLDFRGVDPDCFLRTTARAEQHSIREFRAVHKSGKVVDVELTVSPFPSTMPGRQLSVVVMRDVTQRNAENVANEVRRKLLDTVVNSTSDIVIARDGQGRWIMANAAAKQLYAFVSDANYMMKTHAQIADEFPEFKEHLLESLATDDTAWASRRPIRSEQTFVDHSQPDGKKQFFDVIKTPIFDADGNREMVVIIARNITAIKEKRKHASVAYKALNAASDIVCITDEHGNIVFANKMFLIKYGYTELAAALGRNISEIDANASHPLIEERWATLRNGRWWEGTETCKDLTGREFDVTTTVVPILDHSLDSNYYIWVQRLSD